MGRWSVTSPYGAPPAPAGDPSAAILWPVEINSGVRVGGAGVWSFGEASLSFSRNVTAGVLVGGAGTWSTTAFLSRDIAAGVVMGGQGAWSYTDGPSEFSRETTSGVVMGGAGEWSTPNVLSRDHVAGVVVGGAGEWDFSSYIAEECADARPITAGELPFDITWTPEDEETTFYFLLTELDDETTYRASILTDPGQASITVYSGTCGSEDFIVNTGGYQTDPCVSWTGETDVLIIIQLNGAFPTQIEFATGSCPLDFSNEQSNGVVMGGAGTWSHQINVAAGATSGVLMGGAGSWSLTPGGPPPPPTPGATCAAAPELADNTDYNYTNTGAEQWVKIASTDPGPMMPANERITFTNTSGNVVITGYHSCGGTILLPGTSTTGSYDWTGAGGFAFFKIEPLPMGSGGAYTVRFTNI